MSPPLYLDWDGTVTARDTLHMVIEEFGDLEVFQAMEAELERELSLDEVIAAEMRTITAPFAEVIDWLVERVTVRAGLRELVAAHDPVIVSAGFDEFIQPILEREGVVARVVANTVSAHPDGWIATFRDTPLCAICGQRCKRGVIETAAPFAYAGDGISDRCVALAASRVFARDGLRRWLDQRGAAYEGFGDMDDVRRALAGD